MTRFAPLLGIAALAGVATAQNTVVIPNNTATTEGNSNNAFPWGRGGGGIRIQYVYDSQNFTAQSVATPIEITRLRWRPNANASSAATSYSIGGTVKLSTSPNDQASLSTTMSNNQGNDLATVWNGPVSWPATAAAPGPCPFLIDIPLSGSFYYDPSRGDLNIETELPVQTFSGTALQLDHQTTGSLTSRVTLTAGYANGAPNDTGIVNANIGSVVEVTYVPATGLFARFRSDVTRGTSPLTVNFTDESWSSAAGGVTAWAWDFDGDNVIDSTVQNPSFVYASCGDYDVSLTVTDGTHAPNTFTATAHVRVDELAADFTYAVFVAPNAYQFTDTTTPPATAWAWDFDGDNVTDSVAQNPIWVLPNCALANVRLTASRLCRTSTVTKPIYAAPATLATTATTNGTIVSGQGFFFDLDVTNPQGISICALEQFMAAAPASYTVDFYVTPGTHVGNDTNSSLWRLAGVATGAYNASNPTLAQFASPVYLPMGSYGIALYYAPSVFARFQTNPTTSTFSTPDVTFTNGTMRQTLFGGTQITGRLWAGELHYDTAGLGATAGYGFFGAGCPNSLGFISSLTPSGRPQIGTTLSVTIDNLPTSGTVMCTGFSNTMSLFGPLPFDATPIGAPGCYLRVSTEAVLFLQGVNNTAIWNFVIPNDAVFLGQLFYSQALVIDPAANALGSVASDATGMMIGN